MVGGGHPRIRWFHRGQSHLPRCCSREGLRLFGMLHSIFLYLTTHLESPPDASAACQQPGDYGAHLVKSDLAWRGLAAKRELTPPYCHDSQSPIIYGVYTAKANLTGPLDHLPDLARLGVVAAGEDKEIVAADKPLSTVANCWKTLGADVASHRFFVHFEVRRNLRDREFFC